VSSGFAIVLPARYHSTRFPGKPLALIAGKPLIEWVYRRAQQVRGASRIVVATDHEEIFATVRGFGGEAVMTSSDFRTGTDRVAHVARTLGCDPIVNLQGDEPLFPPALVVEMVALILRSPGTDIVTACHPVFHESDLRNPNAVKVVMDGQGRALYFSRAPIPHRARSSFPAKAPEVSTDGPTPLGFRHVGIYVFRTLSLLRFAELPTTPLETLESLEQLRALEHGMVIRVVKTLQPTVGVDIPDDVKDVEKALSGE
jgi:3-deoxy-manno-octulosonate cytidylyltransferase (CMP-KDO synthetase)